MMFKGVAVVVGVGSHVGGVRELDVVVLRADASSTSRTTPTAWAKIDHALSEQGPDVGFLAAHVSSDGSCHAVHAVTPATAAPDSIAMSSCSSSARREPDRRGTALVETGPCLWTTP